MGFRLFKLILDIMENYFHHFAQPTFKLISQIRDSIQDSLLDEESLLSSLCLIRDI